MRISPLFLIGCFVVGCTQVWAAPQTPYLLLRPDGTFVLPDGEVVSATSSRTNGIQEAIDRAVAENLDLFVMGGDYKGRVYHCSKSIVFPPLQGKSIHLGAATIDFNGFEDRSAPGLVFDSCMNVFFDCEAQIVYHLDGTAVLFKPRNPLPVDTFVGPTLVASQFHFSSIAHVNTPVSYVGHEGGLPRDDPEVCCVAIDPSHSITRCEFQFLEILGGNVGIRVNTPSKSGAFAFNQIRANFVHEQLLASVMEGTLEHSALNDHLRGNRWRLHCVPLPGGTGLEVFGNRGYWLADVLIEKGPLRAGMRTHDSTHGNTFILKNFDGQVTGPFSPRSPGDNRFEN